MNDTYKDYTNPWKEYTFRSIWSELREELGVLQSAFFYPMAVMIVIAAGVGYEKRMKQKKEEAREKELIKEAIAEYQFEKSNEEGAT